MLALPHTPALGGEGTTRVLALPRTLAFGEVDKSIPTYT